MAPDGVQQPTDAELVAAVLGGEQEAYSELLERHQHRVFRILLRLCGNTYDAEELAQEVFFKTYFALPSYRPEHRFSSWLYKIATNHAFSFLRTRNREVSLEFEGADQEGAPSLEPEDTRRHDRPESALERSDRAELLWRAVASLPADFRDIVLMRHVEELSYKEICEATGLSMGTVKSRLARAKQKLERSLAGLG
jgi:RNA polymerase sigma-70 factor (ECF subfamily)